MTTIGIHQKRDWTELKFACSSTTVQTDISKEELADMIKEMLPCFSEREIVDLLLEYYDKHIIAEHLTKVLEDKE